MTIRYAHTNIISADWRTLARFYESVFGCVRVPPERHLSGEWLSNATAVPNAQLEGAHLRLPGHGSNGPTLEIFSYNYVLERLPAVSNRLGFGHLAFAVDDVAEAVRQVIAAGGAMVGEVVSHEVIGVGLLTFAYVTDPEGNIIEVQHWAE
jgi:predicted enzyme related to lactoylglutathione lyase